MRVGRGEQLPLPRACLTDPPSPPIHQVPRGTSKRDIKLVLLPDLITLTVQVNRPAGYDGAWDEVSSGTLATFMGRARLYVHTLCFES